MLLTIIMQYHAYSMLITIQKAFYHLVPSPFYPQPMLFVRYSQSSHPFLSLSDVAWHFQIED